MSRRHRFQAVAVLALLPMVAPVSAQVDAAVCYSSSVDGANVPTNATLFVCSDGASRSLPQLAEAGWRVIKLSQVADLSGSRHQLLIQRIDRLFAHGFQ